MMKHPDALLPAVDDPALPRVLIIGDSISIGYTQEVRRQLQGIANVHRPPINCGPTIRGLQKIDAWLGDGRWDLIHFNFGLHDIKYADEKGDLTDVASGRQLVPLPDYIAHMETLIARMKQTGATLIWRNTTPVPLGVDGRIPGDEVKYNTAAADLMARHGIATQDLYTFAKAHEKEIQLPVNVHYTEEGYAALGREVASAIREVLEQHRQSCGK